MTLATHPGKTVKKNLGESEVPVRFADIDFHPGHWLCADADGLVIASRSLHLPDTLDS